MKHKLSLIVALFCLSTFSLYAQDNFLPKGSSIVKGSIGFSFAKQTTTANNLPVNFDFKTPTEKHRMLNLTLEYDILLSKLAYIGVTTSVMSHKRFITSNDNEWTLSDEFLEAGPNIGFLFGNNQENTRAVMYTFLSPRFVSYLDGDVGFSGVVGLGILLKLKEQLAIDFGINGRYQSVRVEEGYGYTYSSSSNMFIIDLNIGITGLLTYKK